MSFFKRKTSDNHSSAVAAQAQKENTQNGVVGGVLGGSGPPAGMEAPVAMEVVAGSGYAKGRSGMGVGSPPSGQNQPRQTNPFQPSPSQSIQNAQSQVLPNGYGSLRGPAPPNGIIHGKGQPPQPLQLQQKGPQIGGPMPSYPWSTRHLTIAPPTNPSIPAISPFPRYGLSLPPIPTQSGHLLIFGGLVRETVRNDLYALDCQDFSTALVPATGEIPIPRVGHASALVRSVLIVWGGDTKTRMEEDQDESLYLFNIHTKEWTKINPEGQSPRGRYGHAVCMQGSKFYIFGGQVDGLFMSDLWSFDLNSLISTPTWILEAPANDPPPARTGHVMISYQDKIFIFGGTDGAFHYNDTWQYDVPTRTWTELQCIGYIPVPREGHSAALVDDVMYVFGGRDVNGKDLGDLTAFKITNRRWYMFQNMGPAPTGRSGHSMAAFGKHVVVLGGESNAAFAQTRPDDPSVVHVLDTAKIKYPADAPRPAGQQQQVARKSSMPAMNNSSGQPVQTQQLPSGMDDTTRPRTASLGRQSAPPAQVQTQTPVTNDLSRSSPEIVAARAMSPPTSQRGANANPPRSTSSASVDRAPLQGALGPPLNLEPIAERQVAQVNGNQANSVKSSGPPQRPRRQDDDVYGITGDRTRSFSPAESTEAPSAASHKQFLANGDAARSSPTQTTFSRTISPQNAHNAPVVRIRALHSPTTDQAPPADAFYYGIRSPVGAGFPTNRPSSGITSGDVLREMKAQEAEITAGKQREAALRAVLQQAMQSGFILSVGADVVELDSGVDMASGGQSQSTSSMTQALLRLKQNHAALRTELSEATRQADERQADTERLRDGAVQEAAFYRAKLATLDAGGSPDFTRMDQERINELEEQLAHMSKQNEQQQQTLSRLESNLQSEKLMRAEAEEREADLAKCASQASDNLQRTRSDLDQLRASYAEKDATLRDHSERLIAVSSSTQQQAADIEHLRSQLNEATAGRDDYLRLLEEAQQALEAAGVHVDHLHDQQERALSKHRDLEATMADLRMELDAKAREAEEAVQRKLDMEDSWTKSREEADTLRKVTTSRIGELLDIHKGLRADDNRASRGHQEKVQALELEAISLRKLLNEAGSRMDVAQASVTQYRQQAQDLERQQQALHSELRNVKTKLADTRGEVSRLREEATAKATEVRARDVQLSELQTRCAMLRNILADSGVAVSDDDVNADPDSYLSRRLEEQLKLQSEVADKARMDAEGVTRQLDDAHAREQDLLRRIEKLQHEQTLSPSMRSLSPGPSDSRVAEAEKKLSETEAAHKKKVHQLESDYQTAVQYVKGTERVFRRLKDEVTKQKNLNANLQSELDSLQGINGNEAGSRTRSATTSGRGTPTLDVESSRQFQKLLNQHAELQKRFEALQEEMGALRDVNAGREREVDIMRRRVADADSQVAQLREELDHGADHRNWDELEQENSELRQENEILTHKIGLLLDADESGTGRRSGSEGHSISGRRSSRASQTNGDTTFDNLSQELHNWERTFSPDTKHVSGGDDPRRESGDGNHDQLATSSRP